jgi:Transposase, Mutator family
MSPERVNSRNGYRARDFDTRVGSIDLAIPKLRSGSYFPDWLLEPRRRAERALTQVIAECYVRGVSTRRVEGLVKTFGIERLSKSQVSRMAKDLDKEVGAFRTRPLDGWWGAWTWARWPPDSPVGIGPPARTPNSSRPRWSGRPLGHPGPPPPRLTSEPWRGIAYERLVLLAASGSCGVISSSTKRLTEGTQLGESLKKTAACPRS